MPFDFKFCPTFLSCLNEIYKSYLRSKEHIHKQIILIAQELLGNLYPGFGEHSVRKARIGLPEYRIGKSRALRFIYLFIEKKNTLVSIHIYKKGKIKQERKIKDAVKSNLKNILDELNNNECTTTTCL